MVKNLDLCHPQTRSAVIDVEELFIWVAAPIFLKVVVEVAEAVVMMIISLARCCFEVFQEHFDLILAHSTLITLDAFAVRCPPSLRRVDVLEDTLVHEPSLGILYNRPHHERKICIVLSQDCNAFTLKSGSSALKGDRPLYHIISFLKPDRINESLKNTKTQCSSSILIILDSLQ